MSFNPQNPLMIQSDMTILLEVHHHAYEEVRHQLSAFAELEKSPEHIHTYRMSPLSLWNAASSGMLIEQILSVIHNYSKFPVAPIVIRELENWFKRYGILRLEKEDGDLFLYSKDPLVLMEIMHYKSLAPYMIEQIHDAKVRISPFHRGTLKQELTKLGYPVQDLAGYTEGAPLDLSWRNQTLLGKPFELRNYQQQAADNFYAGGSAHGGNGVLVLPCGAGKTVIGLAAAICVQSEVLILASSITASRQWIRELLDKTTLDADQIGEYSGEKKEIRPITVATYQIMSHRKDKHGDFPHLTLFTERNWGLIIYDEVHMLPAPVFRITADIQARRRLGLTATLVREDGLEKDVFALIGPKKYDVPWKDLEASGWIATAQCHEIRVSLTPTERAEYAVSDERSKARMASEASEKHTVAMHLVSKHPDDLVLIIGQYLDQLELISKLLNAPLITGKTPTTERDKLYCQFREGKIQVLVVSKVANFAIDLPDANVAIQLSGQFGSRQEEAQRLGRILRPKTNGSQAYFYSIVSKDTKDQEFAMNRQRFLTEQGYQYNIQDAEDFYLQNPTYSSDKVVSLSAFRKLKKE